MSPTSSAQDSLVQFFQFLIQSMHHFEALLLSELHFHDAWIGEVVVEMRGRKLNNTIEYIYMYIMYGMFIPTFTINIKQM